MGKHVPRNKWCWDQWFDGEDKEIASFLLHAVKSELQLSKGKEVASIVQLSLYLLSPKNVLNNGKRLGNKIIDPQSKEDNR